MMPLRTSNVALALLIPTLAAGEKIIGKFCLLHGADNIT
jgi:hypothetical protein